MKDELYLENIETNEEDNSDNTTIDEDSTKQIISYEPSSFLSLEEITELDKKYILNTYNRMPVSFRYGSGEFLYDHNGDEYIDFLSGIAVTALGHSHADLVETISKQADLLWHTSNIFYNQQQALLARALVEINFEGKVFFANSGTEANEAAIKVMRAFGQSKIPKANKIISLYNSFHGRSMGSMSITGQDKIRNGFGNILEDIIFIDANDVEQLEAAFDEDVCGIIMEPILGEGGILPLNYEFINRARELCDEFGALLTFDEIQTGMARTGKYFAYQHSDVKPDILTMAKGLGGGFPIGAVLVAEEFTDVLQPGMHGSTFGGNHLATAIGYEVIRIIEHQKILNNVEKMGNYLKEQLVLIQKDFPKKIIDVRGVGLLLGLVLREDIEARPLVKKALELKIVIGRAGTNVLRFAPPLIVRKMTIDKAIIQIRELIKSL